jgi:type IV pilus assembly protein PilQ
MKGQTIIPLLSALLVASLTAQEAGTPEPVAAMQRAVATIDSTDQTYTERESEVLGNEMAAPDLPDEPTFEVPQDEVFLDLPGADMTSSAVASDAETISVDFPEEDVRDIIRSVAELYELNVVIPETLAGSVSIKLRDVTWQQVFNVVLEPLNYTYIVDGNIIKIKSQDELAVEPVDTRVFIVDFANAGEIRGSVEPLIDSAAGGRIQVDTRSNALVITERPSRMNDIQEIIETLDRPTEQVMIESKFVEIIDEDISSIGVDWQSLLGYRVQAGPMERVYERINTTERLPTEATEDTKITDSNGFDFVRGSQALGQTNWIDTVSREDTAVFSSEAFQVVLSALERNTGVELVSNPTIVTMNNKRAQINIGEEYPIPQYTYNDERGTFEVSNFEYKPIGVNLNVVPQINSAGFINLDIQPEISSRTGEVLFGGASGASIPIITVRKTNSSVTIKSGYTLAIGGLIQEDATRGSTKVPILGDIPGLGRLFSSKNHNIDKRNLIIFITAKILSASGATYQDVFSEKTLYEMGITKTDIPGYEPTAEEKEMFSTVQNSRDEIEKLKTELKLREQLEALESLKAQSETNLQESLAPPEEEREIRRRYQ